MAHRASAGGKRETFESSALLWARYDAESRTLEVQFPSRHIYRYLEVPEGYFRGLMEADSKGRYFNALIRDRFEMVRISP